MIIDSHVHIGTILNYNLTEELLLSSMNKYNIDFALVSNGEAAETDHEQVLLPPEQQFKQVELNERLIQIVRNNPTRLGAVLWVKPLTEGCSAELEQLIALNRDVIFGIKVHPYHSKISFNSPEVAKYLELAKRYSLPMVVHTAKDYFSSPKHVYEVAKRNPDINFVMVHMGLGTDKEETIKLIAELPNIYGDSTWVRPEILMKAIKVCGIDKILFGTDNPMNGIDTYNDDRYYNFYFKDMENHISKEDYDKFMFGNAIKLFRIKKSLGF